MEVNEKKAQDMKLIVDLSSQLMKLIGEYEDTRASAMSFIKMEEALMWMQVMNHSTNYKGPIFSVKPDAA